MGPTGLMKVKQCIVTIYTRRNNIERITRYLRAKSAPNVTKGVGGKNI